VGPSLGKHKILSLRAKPSAFQVRDGENSGDKGSLIRT